VGFLSKKPLRFFCFRPFKGSKRRYICLHYFSHNSPGGRTREVFELFKDAERLLFRFKKMLVSFVFEFFYGLRHNGRRLKCFWFTWSVQEPQPLDGALRFFFWKETRRKSASLKPLIGFLAFLAGKLWKQTRKINN